MARRTDFRKANRINFKSYSMRNKDFNRISSEGRLRGMKPGNPIIVPGIHIEDSQNKLLDLRLILEQCIGIKVVDIKSGSFSIEGDFSDT